MGFWEEFIPLVLHGAVNTLWVLVISIPASVALAIALGSARVYGNAPLKAVATAFVVTFRGFPLVVTLFLLFFGLADLGIYLTPYQTATLAFVLCGGSYMSEYVRGAIRSIDIGQSLAARALGMTKFQELIYVILPQAIRRALPGISNEIIYQIKYSSLAFVVGYEEIFAVSKTFISRYFMPLQVFMVDAALYLAMTTAAAYGLRALEYKLRIPGLEMSIR